MQDDDIARLDDDGGIIYASYGSERPLSREQEPAEFIDAGSEEWQQAARKQSEYERSRVNTGAYDEFLGRSSPEGKERPERITERTLQPGNRVRGGGGGGSKGRKPARKKLPPKGYNVRVVDREQQLPRFNVDGLSVGEAEYFHGHPGVARAVLAELAESIMDSDTLLSVDAPEKHKSKRKRGFEVYGLSTAQVMALKACAGIATKKLRAYAWERGGDRIRLRDKDILGAA